VFNAVVEGMKFWPHVPRVKDLTVHQAGDHHAFVDCVSNHAKHK
jgi:hypothetical protein